jgi:hypothetical protein
MIGLITVEILFTISLVLRDGIKKITPFVRRQIIKHKIKKLKSKNKNNLVSIKTKI